jgi:hypothetical protein
LPVRGILTVVLAALLASCEAESTDQVTYLAGDKEEVASVPALLRAGVVIQGEVIFVGLRETVRLSTPLGLAQATAQAETRAASLVVNHLRAHAKVDRSGRTEITLKGGTTLMQRVEGNHLTLVRAYLIPDPSGPSAPTR